MRPNVQQLSIYQVEMPIKKQSKASVRVLLSEWCVGLFFNTFVSWSVLNFSQKAS